jgi:hypothetical protein
MTKRTKMALAAVLIAAFATPAAAQGQVPYYNYTREAPAYQTQAPSHYVTRSQRIIEGRNGRIIEGRNAAVRNSDSGVREPMEPMVPDRATVLGN